MDTNPYKSPTGVNEPGPRETRGLTGHESIVSLVAETLVAWAVLLVLFALQLPTISAHQPSPPSVAQRAAQILLFGGAGFAAVFFTGRFIVRIVLRVTGSGPIASAQRRSYRWYGQEICRALSELDAFQRRFFAAWCAEFLVRWNKARILSDLGTLASQELEGYAAEIFDSAARGTSLPASRANEIKARLLDVGPEDDVAKIEVNPATAEALSCLCNAVVAQVDPSVDRVAQVSGNLINVLDYLELQRPGNPYSLEDMFDFPPMAEELRIQLCLIDNLRARRSPSLVRRSVGLGGRGTTLETTMQQGS
jgi:hypothetical protein